MVDYDKLVGSIYDCAANPELWTSTLEELKNWLGTAYLMVGFIDLTPTVYNQSPKFLMRHTQWDVERFHQLQGLVKDAPGSDEFLNGITDSAWTQMAHVTREDFERTPLYREWAEPQGLMDCLTVQYIGRPKMVGVLSGAIHKSRGEFINDEQCRLAERLSPHVRRAMLINDLADKENLALALYRQVLDQLSVAVFVLGLGGRIAFTNASGDAMLSGGNHLNSASGVLVAHRINGVASALDDAIDRASKGDIAIGITGIGVPLIGNDGERAAAYVLPIAGKDLRGDLGQGHCVVFVARRGEQQPMAIEILRTMFDLTVQEARVATLIAKGDRPQAIAEALNVSVNTVRSHLKHAFAKTNARDQTALGALVNGLMPPVTNA